MAMIDQTHANSQLADVVSAISEEQKKKITKQWLKFLKKQFNEQINVEVDGKEGFAVGDNSFTKSDAIKYIESANYDMKEAYRQLCNSPISDFYWEMLLNFPKEWCSGFSFDNDSTINVAIQHNNLVNDYVNNFNISRSEDIFYVRDTSFWSHHDQGLVITDKAIYLCPDNDDREGLYRFPWESLVKFTYKDDNIFIWGQSTKNINDALALSMNYFAKDCSNSQVVGVALADYFTNLAEYVNANKNPLDAVAEEVHTLEEQGKYDEAIELVEQQVDENAPDRAAYCYGKIGDLLVLKSDGEIDEEKARSIAKQSIEYYIKGIDCVEEDNTLLCDLMQKYARGANDFGEFQRARYVYAHSLDGDINADPNFRIYDENFAEKQFLNLDYSERDALMVVSSYTDLEQEHIQVLSKSIASKYLQFPLGHPKENQLYIGHPLIKNYYVPFEEYQLIFVEDQVREYCELAQALGATEISIECLTDKQSDSSDVTNVNFQGGGAVAKASGSIDSTNKESHHLIDAIRQSIEMRQTYHPTKQAYIPEDLKWYEQMPGWQRVAKQRLQGGLLSHEEKIQTSKTQVIDSNALKQIKEDVKVLFKSMNIDFEKEEENKYKMQENAVLVIRVKFAPLEQLQGTAFSQNNALAGNGTDNLSSEEKIFFDEVQFCLEEDNSLSDVDMKFLERKRVKIGLSEERANEIIQMCMPKLSAEEKEYIETYHELVEKGEEISPKFRRILDHEAQSLGISEERKLELEKM